MVCCTCIFFVVAPLALCSFTRSLSPCRHIAVHLCTKFHPLAIYLVCSLYDFSRMFVNRKCRQAPALWIDRSAFSCTHSIDYRAPVRAPSSMNYANETKQNATACNRNNEKRRKPGGKIASKPMRRTPK